MRRFNARLLMLAAGCLLGTFAVLSGHGEADDLGRRYLAVDQSLHANLLKLRLVMGQATARREILRFDAPWELEAGISGNLFRGVVKGHDGMFRAYYEVILEPDQEAVAVAYSTDGIRWTKPALNAAPHLLDRADSNLINVAPHPAMREDKWPGISHVVYDAHAPMAERYKMVWCTSSAAYLATSSDGITFVNRSMAFTHRMEATPSLFYDTLAGEWAIYGRKRGDWTTHNPLRRGIVRHSTTREFEAPWTSVGVVAVDPMDVFEYVPTQTGHPNPDDRSTEDVGPDFYQANVQVYHGQYVGLPTTYFIDPERLTPHRPDRWTGPLYPLFMHSHDGLRWAFPDVEHSIVDMGPHLRIDPHPDWPYHWEIDPDLMEVGQLSPAANFIEHDDQLLIYYSWREDTHDLGFPGARHSYNVALLRVDGFASIRAEENETGQWLTPVLTVPNEAQGLQVNADVAGALQVEVLDIHGSPLAGFSLADSVAFSGDETRAFIKWRTGRFEDLAGKDVQLLFHLIGGEIFSFSFSPVPESNKTNKKK